MKNKITSNINMVKNLLKDELRVPVQAKKLKEKKKN